MRYKLYYKYKNTNQITPPTMVLDTDDFCELEDRWNHILQEFKLNNDKLLRVDLEAIG